MLVGDKVRGAKYRSESIHVHAMELILICNNLWQATEDRKIAIKMVGIDNGGTGDTVMDTITVLAVR